MEDGSTTAIPLSPEAELFFYFLRVHGTFTKMHYNFAFKQSLNKLSKFKIQKV